MDLIRTAYPVSSDDEDEMDQVKAETAPEIAHVGVEMENAVAHAESVETSQDHPIVKDGGDVASTSVEGDENDAAANPAATKLLPSNSDSFRQIQSRELIYDSETESVATINISDSESLDSSDISDHDEEKIKAKKRQPPKAKGELGLRDLPPIEDLHISVPHEECEAIGFVKSIVDTLVVVEAYPLSPALDIDSVLFLEEGDEALGQVFDVFGPVKHPHYSVRFNSTDHINSRGVKLGALVYCAPKTPHTSYVLVAQLLKFKGTDASWKDDHETPNDQLEFSDDEAEAAAKGRTGSQSEINEEGVPSNRPIKRACRKTRSARGNGVRGGHTSNTNSGNIRHHLPRNHYVPAQVAGFGLPRQRFQRPYYGYGRPSYDQAAPPVNYHRYPPAQPQFHGRYPSYPYPYPPTYNAQGYNYYVPSQNPPPPPGDTYYP